MRTISTFPAQDRLPGIAHLHGYFTSTRDPVPEDSSIASMTLQFSYLALKPDVLFLFSAIQLRNSIIMSVVVSGYPTPNPASGQSISPNV